MPVPEPLFKGGFHKDGLTISKTEAPGVRAERRIRDRTGVGA